MMLASDDHQRRPGLLDSFQQSDRLAVLVERLRDILMRQLEEPDTSIAWEDGESRDGEPRR
jgi:hypothetical protein